MYHVRLLNTTRPGRHTSDIKIVIETDRQFVLKTRLQGTGSLKLI